MKKLAAITISLLTAATVATGGAAAADELQADTLQTVYPATFTQELTFSKLTDFAVGDGVFAFAEDNYIKVLENDFLTVYEFDYDITDLDYADGTFYYRDERGKTAAIADDVSADHPFDAIDELSVGNYFYYVIGGEIKILNKDTDEILMLDGFTDLKKYGESMYAVYRNTLYAIDGFDKQALTFYYTDFSAAEQIAVGEAASALKNAEFSKIGVVTLKTKKTDGSPVYMTQITLNDVNGEYFSAGETVKVGEDIAAGTKMLLLCETGNAYIVSDGRTAYILDSTGVNLGYENVLTPDFNSATLSVDDSCYAYYLPYICGATQSFELTTGKHVTIEGMADRRSFSALAYDFYLISYENDDGETLKGYVPASYLTMFTFIEKQPEVTEDPDYSSDDHVKTVVVILAIVVLVLFAAGYLVYVGTSDKNKPQDDKDGTSEEK